MKMLHLVIQYIITLHYFPFFYSKPIIGIFGLPNPQSKTEKYLNDTVGESYVRFLEASGATTVVIHPWSTESELDTLLSKVNGVVFQGGGVPLGTTTQYDRNVKYILTKAKQYFDSGDYFPVLGICLGFESILIVEANNKEILGYFNDSERAHPSILTDKIEFSRQYSLFSESDFDILENEDSTHHFHIRGVSEDAFNNYTFIKEHYSVTLLANDKDGKTFVSSFEGIKYPIYGLQYHPEKTPYNKEGNYPLDHTAATIKVSQLLGIFFVNEASKSKHTFDYSSDIDKYDFINTSQKGAEVLHEHFIYYYGRKHLEQIYELKFLES